MSLEVTALLERLEQQEAELDSMAGELIQTQDQLLALYDLANTMRSRLQAPDALAALAQEAARLLNADGVCATLCVDDQTLRVQFPAPLYSESALKLFWDHLAATDSHFMLSPEEHPEMLPTGAYAGLFLPLRVHGRPAGMVGLLRASSRFLSPDLKLAQAFSEQASGYLENLLLYRETLSQARLQAELDLAKRVHLHLLPQRLPMVEGLDIAASSLPALQIGGDLYDFMEAPGRPFSFAVGDVTGKGMSAAMLMAMTRTLLRSKARSAGDLTPVELVAAVNDELYDDFSELGMFATLFAAQYDKRERLLTCANAGHSPVIYCPYGGEAVLLKASGTAVGVLPICNCENELLELYPGDVLVAATDGFNEARSLDDELYSIERLLGDVQRSAHLSAEGIRSELGRAVAVFSAGRSQDDDQTIVVIKGT